VLKDIPIWFQYYVNNRRCFKIKLKSAFFSKIFHKFQVDKGVYINAKDNKGYTPMITACQYGHVALVAFLVSRGARIEAEDSNGDNALHWV
jgi:hypothetical protein